MIVVLVFLFVLKSKMESSPQNDSPSFSSASSLLDESVKFNLDFLKKYIGLQACEFFFVDDEGEFVEELRKFLVLKVLAKDLDASILSPSAFIDKVCFLSLVPLFLFFFSFLFSLFSFLFSLFSFLFSLFSFLFSLFSFLFSLFSFLFSPFSFPSPLSLLTSTTSQLWHAFLLFPIEYSSFCNHILPPDIPSPRLIGHNPFGMFPSHISGGGGSGGDGGGGGGGSVGENSGMGSRDVSGRSKRYLKTYQMYLDCFQITPPTRYWPSPFEPSSSPSSSRKRITREVDHLSSPPTKKPRSTTNTDTDTDRISLIVIAQDGSETHFTIRKTTPLQKLMSAWCQRMDIDPDRVKFLHDGQRLIGFETPVKLDMKDGDIVDTMLHKAGC